MLPVFLDCPFFDKGQSKKGQSSKTGNIRYTNEEITKQTKQKQKHNTICVEHHYEQFFC
jgi:hypothetical protein